MFYRTILALALLIACSSAFSQQTQSNSPKLKLEQFPEQSTNEAPTNEAPTNETNKNLQLDLNQFEQQQGKNALELNLNQFDQKKPTDRSAEQSTNSTLEVNLEQFDKNGDSSKSRQNVNINSNSDSISNSNAVESEKPELGKINSAGSAVTKIDRGDSTKLSDDAYLLRTGLWFLAIAIPVFLFIRARIRKRRRQRPPGQSHRRPSYDESDHR